MANGSDRIVFNREEFVDLLMQNNNLLFEISALQEDAMMLVAATENLRSPGGNPFYQGKVREGMDQYYTMLAANINTLTQFYGKLVEYMIFIGEELEIGDEFIADQINRALEGGE